MRATESRLSDGFPAILMTLVSLIVAITIETAVSTVGEIPNILELNEKNLFTWAQAFGTAVGPLEYWFTMSLHSTAIRGAFVPRDALGPLVPGFFFIPLASTVGASAEVAWLLIFATLMGAAWFAFREFGRRYENDAEVTGNRTSHRVSGRMHLAVGIVGIAAAIGIQFGTIRLGHAAVLFFLMMIVTIIGHVKWYREWQQVSGDGGVLS